MTNRDRIVVGVLACVVAVAGFWFLALKPKRADLTAATARADQAQTQLQSANAALATAAAARASFETDYATLARLGKAVPQDDDAASLVFQIETAARKAGIDFRSLSVGSGGAPAAAPSAGGSASAAPAGSSAADAQAGALPPGVAAGTDGMNRLPFTFVFDGDYFALARLLDMVHSFATAHGDTVTVSGRLLTVEGVSLQEGGDGFPDVKATINATAYLAAEPITVPGGATSQASPAPVPTAPSAHTAGTASGVPSATVIPGAVR
jgi:hypothetical protein